METHGLYSSRDGRLANSRIRAGLLKAGHESGLLNAT